MKVLKFLLLIVFGIALTPLFAQDAAIEKTIKAKVAAMSLDEKIGQTALRGRSSREKGKLSEEINNPLTQQVRFLDKTQDSIDIRKRRYSWFQNHLSYSIRNSGNMES